VIPLVLEFSQILGVHHAHVLLVLILSHKLRNFTGRSRLEIGLIANELPQLLLVASLLQRCIIEDTRDRLHDQRVLAPLARDRGIVAIRASSRVENAVSNWRASLLDLAFTLVVVAKEKPLIVDVTRKNT
jgi:hypothetical protein